MSGRKKTTRAVTRGLLAAGRGVFCAVGGAVCAVRRGPDRAYQSADRRWYTKLPIQSGTGQVVEQVSHDKLIAGSRVAD